MIEDAAEMPAGARLRTPLCVVGGGPAGIALALRVAAAGCPVLLLESGGATAEREAQLLNEGEADSALHPPPRDYRLRKLGGATGLWGGRCVPFDPIDFVRRDWIAHSGWPIGMEALAPYYEEANALCEAGDFAYRAEGGAAILPGFRGRHFSDHTLERFSCPTDFGTRYRARLAASRHITVLLHATVTAIQASASGEVLGLQVRNAAGVGFAVEAERTVLAAGGLETARLLLASRQTFSQGIGNHYDLVGRFYMCHIAGTTGELRPAPGSRVRHGYEKAADGVWCRRRFALREAAQRRLGLSNFVARLHHPRIGDPAHRSGALSMLHFARPFIRAEYARRLRGSGGEFGHLRNLLLDAGGAAGFAAHCLRRRVLAVRKFPSVVVAPKSGAYSVDFHAEQVPDPESRVFLGRRTDAFGMPQLIVAWRCGGADIDHVQRAVAALAEDVEAGGSGQLRHDPEAVARDALRDGAYGGHHIGTARMSASPRHGVVDADCRVHGLHNLYIAGSAVFPTSGQANPTLTLVALALRLADHLAGRMGAASPLPPPPVAGEDATDIVTDRC